MILITGAAGTVGGQPVMELDRQQVATRSLVRTAEKADSLRGFDTHVALGGDDDPGAGSIVQLVAVQAGGGGGGATDEVQKATGRPAHSVDDFLMQHRAVFRTV